MPAEASCRGLEGLEGDLSPVNQTLRPKQLTELGWGGVGGLPLACLFLASRMACGSEISPRTETPPHPHPPQTP